MIKFRNVNKSFGRNTVLKDISFTVDKGNLVTIIGASGCGKTTTLKMINRLIKPTSGDIFIGGGEHPRQGRDSAAPGHGLRNPADRPCSPHMTVRENIEIIPKLSRANPEQTRKRTLELMEMVGMDRTPIWTGIPQALRRPAAADWRGGPSPPTRDHPMDEPFRALDPSPGPSSRTSCWGFRTT